MVQELLAKTNVLYCKWPHGSLGVELNGWVLNKRICSMAHASPNFIEICWVMFQISLYVTESKLPYKIRGLKVSIFSFRNSQGKTNKKMSL